MVSAWLRIWTFLWLGSPLITMKLSGGLGDTFLWALRPPLCLPCCAWALGPQMLVHLLSVLLGCVLGTWEHTQGSGE